MSKANPNGDLTYSPSCYEFNALRECIYKEYIPEAAIKIDRMLVHECDAVYVGDNRYIKVEQFDFIIRKYYSSSVSSSNFPHIRGAVMANAEQSIKLTATKVVNYSWPVTSLAWQSAYINYVKPNKEAVRSKPIELKPVDPIVASFKRIADLIEDLEIEIASLKEVSSIAALEAKLAALKAL